MQYFRTLYYLRSYHTHNLLINLINRKKALPVLDYKYLFYLKTFFF